MEHIFPEKTVKRIYEQAAFDKQLHPKRSLYKSACSLLAFFKEHPFGFITNLKSGNYAPYPHEMFEQQISDYN